MRSALPFILVAALLVGCALSDPQVADETGGPEIKRDENGAILVETVWPSATDIAVSELCIKRPVAGSKVRTETVCRSRDPDSAAGERADDQMRENNNINAAF